MRPRELATRISVARMGFGAAFMLAPAWAGRMWIGPDGVVRLWGTGVETGNAQIRFVGTGITPVEGYSHVYQLAR